MRNMSKMARFVIIIAIITIASFVIAGTIFFVQYGGNNFSVLKNEGLRPANAVNVDEEKTQSAAGINKIYVSTTSDSINILQSDSGEIKAHYYGYYASTAKDYVPEFTVEAAGDEVRIKVEYPSILGPISFNSNLRLDVYLPAEYAKNLDIRTTSASVNIDGINSLESFSCTTTSGSLKAGTVNAAAAKLNATSGSMLINGTYRSFEFSATSGSFKTDGITAKTASLQTTSGSIALSGNPGNVDARSTSGSIQMEYAEYASNITAQSTSGSIRIKLPANAEFRISHKTASGGSNIAFPLTITGSTGRKGIEGTVVSDRNTINVTTSSGSLEIVK